MIPALFLTLTIAFNANPALPSGAFARFGNTKLCHGDSPTKVAIDPSGNLIATIGNEGCLKLWNASTGTLQGEHTLRDFFVVSVTFTNDGRNVLTHSSDHTVRVYSTDKLTLIHTQRVTELLNTQITSDGQLIAGFSQNRRLRVRYAQTGKEVWNSPLEYICAFEIQPRYFALADESNLWLWERNETNNQVTMRDFWKLSGKSTPAYISISPKADKVAVAGSGLDSSVQIFETGKETATDTWQGQGPIAFADNTSLYGNVFGIINHFKQGVKDPKEAINSTVSTFAITPDGKTMVTTGNRAKCKVWEMPAGKERVFEGLNWGPVSSLHANAEQLRVGTRTGVHTVSLKSMQLDSPPVTTQYSSIVTANTCVHTNRQGVFLSHGEVIPFGQVPSKMAVSADGNTLVGAWADNYAIYDFRTKRLSKTWNPLGDVQSLALSANGTNLATVSIGGFLRAYTVDEPPRELWVQRVPRSQNSAVTYSPDGSLVAVASLLRVELFDTATGTRKWFIERAHEDGPFLSVAFSPDGRLIAAGCQGYEGGIVVYETVTRTLIRRYTANSGSTRILQFANHQTLFSVTSDECVLAWDVSGRRGLPVPTGLELEQAWTALARTPARHGHAAMETLSSSPAAAMAVIREGIRDTNKELKAIEGLIVNLDAVSFAEREDAQKALSNFGMRASELLIPAAKNHQSMEVRKRAANILKNFEQDGEGVAPSGLFGHSLRLVRTVQLLEEFGNKDAQMLLAEIARIDNPAATLAQSALKRLANR